MLMLLALPLALHAQEYPAPASPAEPAAALADRTGDAAAPCKAPSVALPDAVPPAMAVPFDATGVVFTLPGDAADSACQPAVPAPPPRPPAPDIFGLSAVPVGLKFAAREGEAWGRVANASLQGMAGPWNELLDRPGLPGADTLLVTVNNWVNWHVRYAANKDPNAWNLPATTLLDGSGDCADYAVAKMALLEQLGVAPQDMFLVVLRDESRSIDHAVLAVRREGAMYVLDNQTDMVLPAERIHDYRPILSYNGPFAWVYGKRTSERKTATPTLER